MSFNLSTAVSAFLAGTADATQQNTVRGQLGLGTSASPQFAGLNLGGDVALVRAAANTLALRNDTNAQALLISNTYTDDSNYERGFFRWVGNALEIGMEAAGTGTLRGLNIDLGDSQVVSRNLFLRCGGSALTMQSNGVIGTSGFLRWGIFGSLIATDNGGVTNHAVFTFRGRDGGNAAALDLSEFSSPPSAPSENSCRIFAEDDGSGKTRLMVRFPSGASQQIAIEP